MQNLSWSAQHTPLTPVSWSNFTQDKSHLKQDWLQNLMRLLRTLSRWILVISKAGDYSTSLSPCSILCSLWFFSFYPGGLPLATRSPSPCPCAVTLFGSALSSSHSPHRLQVPGTPWSVRSVLQQAAVGKDSEMAPQLGPCHYTSLNNPASTFPTCTQTSNPAPKNITPEVYPALKKFLRGCAKQRLELLKTDKTNTI